MILTMMGGNLIFFPSNNVHLVWSGPVSSLTGIQFGDNGGHKYLTEENGVAMATTQVFEKSLK